MYSAPSPFDEPTKPIDVQTLRAWWMRQRHETHSTTSRAAVTPGPGAIAGWRHDRYRDAVRQGRARQRGRPRQRGSGGSPVRRRSLQVDDPHPPFSFVQVQGLGATSEDPQELLDTTSRIAARYMGADRGAEFGRRNAVPGGLVVRARPTRVVSAFNLQDRRHR
jgi:hypothetical protein